MNKVQCRLCEVKLRDDEQEFVVNALDIMKKDIYYPAAHIIDPESEENIYLVYAEEIHLLVSSDGVVENTNYTNDRIYNYNVKEIKQMLRNMELHVWIEDQVRGKYEIGQITAIRDLTVSNNVEGSNWKEMFNKGDVYITVRKKGTHEVAIQVRKGAIFYISTEDLEHFSLREYVFSPHNTIELNYDKRKEYKYIIENLYKK